MLVEPGLGLQHGLLGGFEDRVKTAEDGYGKDDVAVLASAEEVAENIVRDSPDVIGDPVEVGGRGRGGHVCPLVGVQLNPVRCHRGHSIS